MEIEVKGDVKPGFESVRDEFARLWQDIEIGASFCAFHQGTKIVDLWGGFTDREMTQQWQADTLVNIYSTTKGPALRLPFSSTLPTGYGSMQTRPSSIKIY